MIIINLSCSGYVVKVNGEQVSVVGLNTKYGKNTMYTQHRHLCFSPNQSEQWFNTVSRALLKTRKQKRFR